MKKLLFIITLLFCTARASSYATWTINLENNKNPYSCFQGRKIRETRLANRYAFFELEGKIYYFFANFSREMLWWAYDLYTLDEVNHGICNSSTYFREEARKLNPFVCNIMLSPKLKRVSVRMREKDFKKAISCLKK